MEADLTADGEDGVLDHRLEDVRERQVGEVAVGGVELDARAVRGADRDGDLLDAHALWVAGGAARVPDGR